VTKRSKPFSDDDTVKKHRVVFYCQIIDRKADKNDFSINLVFSMADSDICPDCGKKMSPGIVRIGNINQCVYECDGKFGRNPECPPKQAESQSGAQPMTSVIQ
jgi:hypothetical protein